MKFSSWTVRYRRRRPEGCLAVAATLVLTTALAAAGVQAGEGVPLAVTLDDLPYVGGVAPVDEVGKAVERILAAAGSRGVPLAGFVTCRNAEGRAEALRRWIAADVTLGNHSWSHRSLDRLGLEAWRSDITRCQDELVELAGRPVRFFRYPFLRTGADRSLRDAGFATLEELGLRRAPVSIDTSEWVLVRPYLEALEAGDGGRAREIAGAYVAHLRAASRRAVRTSSEIGHPAAPQILLLHANALAADQLGDVLDALRGDGFRFVALEEALADPLYRREDHWAGDIGLSWLYRVDPQVDAVRRWTWEAAQQHAFEVRFGGADEREVFDLDRDLKIRRLAERTWMVTYAEPWSANSLLAEMPDGSLLLVDTPTTEEGTRSLLDWIGARFGDARIAVINSHSHPDALGGNRVLAAAGATIHGSTRTARLLAEQRETVGAVLVEELSDRPALAEQFTAYHPVPPQVTFAAEEGLRLAPGGEPVVVLFPGPAHSPDNLAVWLPSRKVLFGGCMVRAGETLGNLRSADLQSWPSSIRALKELGAEVIVPGHGQRTDPQLLDHTSGLLEQARGGTDTADIGRRQREP